MERMVQAPVRPRMGQRQPLTTVLLVVIALVAGCRTQRFDDFNASDWSARVGPEAEGKAVLRVQGIVDVPRGYATWLMLHSPPSINPSILELDLVPMQWSDYSEEGPSRLPVTFSTDVGAMDAYRSVVIFFGGTPRLTLQCQAPPSSAAK